MTAHTLRITAFAAIVLGGAAAPALRAGMEPSRTTYLTFNAPVALPGVTLRSGAYAFELADPEASPDIVRVTSRDRKIVYFTAFTRAVDRPARVPLTQLVSLGEVAPGEPVPIEVWWSDARQGREFIYTR